MAQQVQDMFTTAMGGGSVRRIGDMVLMALPGANVVTNRRSLQDVQCWARGLRTCGDAKSDRLKLLDRIETLIGPLEGADAACSTRGSPDALGRLARAMQAGGLDLSHWALPSAVRAALPPAPLPIVEVAPVRPQPLRSRKLPG